MRRHIAFAVIKKNSNLHLKNEKACNCDNLRKFLLLFISHFFFCLFLISLKKTGQKNCAMYACNSLYIKVAELNTPSDGNVAYHH